jgi:hypothetical protein
MISSLLKKSVDIYGGEELWKKSTTVEAIVNVSGLLFKLKRRPLFRQTKVKVDIHRLYSIITPIGNDATISGVLDGDNVYLQNDEGKIVAERKNPRKYFPYGRRLFYWDDLDMAYFANYAFWNYLTLPNILMNKDIKWVEKEKGIEADFPDYFHTHSKKQLFIFDQDTGKLIQHNYTAVVVSGLATAANVVKEHKTENGILYPSHRVITPQSKKKGYLNKPVIVNDEVLTLKMY